jgi:hypothetical protein
MIDEDLANLEDWLRRLNVEYRIFFSGNRKKPPDDLKLRVEKVIKRLSEATDMNFTQRFRFSTLVTRFYVYRDLWRREVHNREMDLAVKEEDAAKQAYPSPSPKTPAEAIRVSISDPKVEAEKMRLLYDALTHIRKKGSPQTLISYQQFAKYIEAQVQSIQKKYGCSKVAFTIALDEDALRFTAAAETS